LMSLLHNTVLIQAVGHRATQLSCSLFCFFHKSWCLIVPYKATLYGVLSSGICAICVSVEPEHSITAPYCQLRVRSSNHKHPHPATPGLCSLYRATSSILVASEKQITRAGIS
jgi:hypothetical protein